MRTSRIEVVTTTFVASGVPAGARDIECLLENLNNPAISRYIEITDASVRPLYRAASPLLLEAPMFVRRNEVIFATFEGQGESGPVEAALPEAACLLLAPPFQIQARTSFAHGADPSQALQSALAGFFVVRDASVYDADGYLLGHGEQIVVNGAAVQMATPTNRHIVASGESSSSARRRAGQPSDTEADAHIASAIATRAA